MSEQKLRSIYDALSKFESNTNGERNLPKLYPIHKRLKIPVNKSLFDYILENIKIRKHSRVLDLGCGVGYGLLFLHQKLNCSGLGVSISSKEVSLAKQNAKIKVAEDDCRFTCQSYDDAIEGKYDILLAIESLKHSPDLSRTFQNIVETLNPGAQLIIVEDFLSHKTTRVEQHSNLKSYQDFWALYEVYTKNDFEKCIKQYPDLKYSYLDLSQYIPKKSKWKLRFSIQLMRIMRYIPISHFAKVAPIFLGGLNLEMLYHSGSMSYEILLVEKHQSS